MALSQAMSANAQIAAAMTSGSVRLFSGTRTTDVFRGGDKGKGNGDKGAGKGGFKGTCYKCGKQGHKAADCRTRVDMADEYEDEDECQMQPVGGVWTSGQIEVQKNRGSWQAGNRFAAIAIDDEDEIPVMAVEHVDRTRESAIEFNVAEVRKPLASAVRMVMAGNRVVLDSDDSYIEKRKTGERMKLKVKDGTYVFDVQYKDGEVEEFTLDSGAGVNVWPQSRREDIPMPNEVAYACVPPMAPRSRTWAARSCSSAEKAEAGHSSSSGFTPRV